ncbi:MAG: DUF2284 domain-containing protein [Lachnospiraceae bacterium]|nr:DUF2284 domain-containing protein [Lachnospiraceae bacterium]
MYTTKRYTASISIDEYLENYVDIPTFLECCKACPNYNQIWSCPTYDFDVESYWKQYHTFDLIGVQMIFDEESRLKEYTAEELNKVIKASILPEKQKLTDELFKKEKEVPNSISLSAGSCIMCGKGNCTKPEGKPCRHPEKMRYSIESLGGNVGKTIHDLFHVDLEWMEEGKLPTYFVLVCGLLS